MKKAEILIVEDDFIVANMLEKNLAELGYGISGKASSGEDAIAIAEKNPPSLVLLDIRLVGPMDGITVAQKIHDHFHIPVVYLTAHSDDTTFNRAISTALYGYLIKPVTMNALRTTIEVALEKFRIEESLRQANKKLNLLSSITRHDILNTLTALMAAVDMSIETATDPAFCEHLERENILLKQIQRQIEFTRDYESLGAGAPVWHDVEAVVNKVAKQVLPPSVTIETGMKGVLIFADPLFEKVIYNLMDNAVRHGKTATRIRFFTREDTAGLTLVCEDNGEGVAADEKDRIFFRGYGKNTGLGLFLVREILGITGFGITETGTFMNGARFEIRVPYGMYRL